MRPPTPPRTQVQARTPSAIALMLQATPWTPLSVRRGSSEEVTLDVLPNRGERGGGGDEEVGDILEVLVWQFSLAEFDVGFQIARNDVPIADMFRYKAEESTPNAIDSGANGAPRDEDCVLEPFEGKLEELASGDSIALKWDNSYSLVRHKQVYYRVLMTSRQALEAAESAANELRKRAAHELSNGGETYSLSRSPFYVKDLAKLRAMPSSERETLHNEMVVRLEECVMDLVSIFMANPNCPLHEGASRSFVLSLEAVLLDGIKEAYTNSWPEAPYYEFLTNMATVLRDDKGIVATVKALDVPVKLQYIGWNKSRALLHIALNEGIFHRAFENLTKRRQLVEKYYEPSAILYSYPTAATISSFLSALNAVKFLLEPFPVDDSTSCLGFEEYFPPNLEQASPEENPEEADIAAINGFKVDALVVKGVTVEPSEISQLQCCSIPRYCLCAQQWQDLNVGYGVAIVFVRRGSVEALEPTSTPATKFAVIVQIRVSAQDILLRISDADHNTELIEPLRVFASDVWVEIALRITAPDELLPRVQVKLDNSYSMVRTKQIQLRYNVISMGEYEHAWQGCREMAQSITWKHASSVGKRRCKSYMESQHIRDKDAVTLQRTQSGATDEDDENRLSILGFRNSLITNPVSRLVGGFLTSDANSSSACAQCLTPFSFFSRQHVCPLCRKTVCVPCSRHYVQERGRATQLKVCDRCFVKEKDKERSRLGMTHDQDGPGKEVPAFAALRADPTMEKYFKMLSVGVPPSAVAQKMAQDEVLPNKLAVFSAGPDGSGGNSTGSAHLRRSRSKSHFQRRDSTFRKVYWTSLESKKADETIWGRVTSRRRTAPIKLSPSDFQELEQLFGVKPMAAKSEDEKAKSKKNVIRSALDPRRSNNISIGLSQFKSVGGVESILRALDSCDLAFLTLERLETLLEIAPTAVETKRYTNFRGSRARLEPAELFLVQMCEIPRVTEKIATFVFAAQFQHQRNELQVRMATISKACWQILESERLARCFELVLTIGNLLNAGTELEDAHGITLPSLLKLSETKSIDRSMTLLQFIIKLVQDRGEGDVLLFINDLNSLAEAKRYSNLACSSQFRTLQHGIGTLQNEIKEDMANDRTRFDKEEDQRRKLFEQRQRQAQMPPVPRLLGAYSSVGSTGDGGQRNALLAAIRQRSGEPTIVESNQTTQAHNELSASTIDTSSMPQLKARAAMLAAIQQRPLRFENTLKDHGSDPNSETKHSTTEADMGAFQPALLNSNLQNNNQENTRGNDSGRTALFEAIKQHGQRDGDGASPSRLLRGIQHVTKENTINPASSVSRPDFGRASLLAAIKQHGERGSGGNLRGASIDVTNSSSSGREISSEKYVPQEYKIRSKYIPVMREVLMGMKADIEEIEEEMETLQSLWEATARYLGEVGAESSSEYVFSLLNRFILDVKVAKSLLFRKGIRFSTDSGSLPLLPDAQVGSKILTEFGGGVVTAMRVSERRLEVSFSWCREAYLSPTVVLAAGALVRSRQFGVGIIRSTRYMEGFCCVRFAFGLGVISVDDLVPETASNARQLRAALLISPVLVGDPVITPFGCGHVLWIRRVPLQSLRNLELRGGGADESQCSVERIVAVELLLMTDSGERSGQALATSIVSEEDGADTVARGKGGIAYVPESRVRLNY